MAADFALAAADSVLTKARLENGEIFAKLMLSSGSLSAAFIAIRITVMVVCMGICFSTLTAHIADFITVIFISVRHIIFLFFSAICADLGANMLVGMSEFCAYLTALITILVAATLIAMLATLTGKTAKIALAVAGGRILVPCCFSFGKALVTASVAGVIVGVVLSLAKSAAQVAGGIAGVIINVTYLTNKTAIAAVRIAIVFEIVGLGSPSGSANIALTVARIGIKVRRGWTNKFALVAVKIAFI